MESEKVKEIKKIANLCIARGAHCSCCAKEKETDSMLTCRSLMKELLTLINELESENERLSKALVDNLEAYKDGFNEGAGLKNRVDDKLKTENQQLKARIAELENGIAKSMLGCEFLPECTNNKLKQFAERLKEIVHKRDYVEGYAEIGLCEEIDETLKECLKNG